MAETAGPYTPVEDGESFLNDTASTYGIDGVLFQCQQHFGVNRIAFAIQWKVLDGEWTIDMANDIEANSASITLDYNSESAATTLSGKYVVGPSQGALTTSGACCAYDQYEAIRDAGYTEYDWDIPGGTSSESGPANGNLTTAIADALDGTTADGNNDKTITFAWAPDVEDSPIWRRWNSMEATSYNGPTLEYRYTATAAGLPTDGESISSGTAKVKDGRLVGKWHGVDSAQVGDFTDCFVAAITSGRGDLTPHVQSGQNMFASAWVSPSDRITTGPGRGTRLERRSLKSTNWINGNGAWFSWQSHYYDKNPDTTSWYNLDTYSARFYCRSYNSREVNHDIFRFYNTDSATVLGLYVLGSDIGTENAMIFFWSDGNSGQLSPLAYIFQAFDRIEIQASEYADPKVVIRVYTDDETTPFATASANPASIAASQFSFGHTTGYNLFYDEGSVDYADIEIWDNYDLNGEFAVEPSLTGGTPYTAQEWEWYYYNDDGDIEGLEDLGVIRYASSDGSSITFTHEPTPLPALDWHSNLSGSDEASVIPQTSNDFHYDYVAANASVVYDTDLSPSGITTSIRHTNAASTAALSASVPATDRVYARMYLYFDDLFSTQGGTSSQFHDIFAFLDGAGDAIYSLCLRGDNMLISQDGEGPNGSQDTISSTLFAADKWYRLEVLYDKNTNTADSDVQIWIRIFDDDNDDEVYQVWSDYTTLNKEQVQEVKFGLFPALNGEGGAPRSQASVTMYTAGHAIDTTDWVAGAVNGYEPDIQYGSYSGGALVYKEPYRMHGASSFYIGAGYIETGIRYGIGTGDTALRYLNFYAPDGDRPENGWPCMLFVHGGSWAGGLATDVWNDEMIEHLLLNGYAVISIDYQLAEAESIWNIPLTNTTPPAYSLTDANAGRWPTFILDVKQAIHWVKNNAGASPYYIDLDRVGGYAYSAGTQCLMGAVMTKDISDDGASVVYDWTLAGNGSVASADGNTYYYDDEGQGDPELLKAIYLGAPIINLRKAVDFERDMLPSGFNVYNAAYGPMESTIYNSYAEQAWWYNDANYNNFSNWMSMNASIAPSMGWNFGDIDWFVISDPNEYFPAYSQAKEVRDTWSTNASVIPATSELDIFESAMHHDRVAEEWQFEHFLAFVRRNV